MSVSPSSFPKQPDEVFSIEVEFDKRLTTDEQIQTVEIIAYLDTEDVTSTIISGNQISTDGKSVTIGVKGGTDGNNYKITVRGTTDSQTPANADFTHEGDVTMAVVSE